MGARESIEPGCIELLFPGGVYIVKPSTLLFRSFGPEYEWAYFRLETERLNPSGIYEKLPYPHEELLELRPGHYVEYSVLERGFYGYDENGYEKPLPAEARPLTRVFEGSFVIFAKGSTYNRNPDTYDARHNKVTAEQFEQYIRRNAEEQ